MSGCGRTGNTRLSSEDTLVLGSSINLLAGGSSREPVGVTESELELKEGIEQETGEGETEEDKKVNLCVEGVEGVGGEPG